MKKSIAISRRHFYSIAFVLIFIVFSLFTACSKTGSKGATGPQGVAGPQGQAGPVGSRIYSGAGAPADTLGLPGDYYIDDQASALYGPKTVSGWGTAISLKGAPGVPGSQILSGTVLPQDSLGNVGDYYFNRMTDSLYGPKSGSGWGTAVSLRGAAGTANVIYYNWVGFKYNNWGAFDATTGLLPYPISVPAITSDITTTGVVLIYIEYVNANTKILPLITQIPGEYLDYENNAAGPYNKEILTDELSVGNITFYNGDASDLNNPGGLFFIGTISTFGYMYRIVIIPGGVAGTGIDPHRLTYQQVCANYGIQP
jgi:hypothetical protein